MFKCSGVSQESTFEGKKKLGFCPFKAVLLLAFVAHFYMLKNHQDACDEFTSKGGFQQVADSETTSVPNYTIQNTSNSIV